jgi:hypothetical protein
VILRIVTANESKNILKKFHNGFCGGHVSTKATTHEIHRANYYWSTLFFYVHLYVRNCESCQQFASTQNYQLCLWSLLLLRDFFSNGVLVLLERYMKTLIMGLIGTSFLLTTSLLGLRLFHQGIILVQ